jgi:hypothetical protein
MFGPEGRGPSTPPSHSHREWLGCAQDDNGFGLRVYEG